MPAGLTRIALKNYRALADISVNLSPINVLFGPNGAGKSTLLDTIWFFRDCAVRGVETASTERDHGIGLLYDGAESDASLSVTIADDRLEYELNLALSQGRIEPFAGERLYSPVRDQILIDRSTGSDVSTFFHGNVQQTFPVTLREPQKISLGLYLDFNQQDAEAAELDELLHHVRYYQTRFFNFYGLRKFGSKASHEVHLYPRADNAWSVLRNVQGRRSVDGRFDTIMQFMRKSFPTFGEVLLEATGPSVVYAKFVEMGRRSEIMASGVSDGHLQLLLLLTALFSEYESREAILIFDEPETSLHPWAIAVFAEAVKLATRDWNRQVLIATHSPVLISQFAPSEILVATLREGRTDLRRLSEMVEVQDLLEQYAAGSLYEAQLVGEQNITEGE